MPRKRPISLMLVLALAACPVEHVGYDGALPVYDAAETQDANTRLDARSADDAVATQDATTSQDAGILVDANEPGDANATADSSSLPDTTTTSDTNAAPDTNVSVDAHVPPDANTAPDVNTLADTHSAPDSNTAPDTNTAPDVSTVADAGATEDAGLPVDEAGNLSDPLDISLPLIDFALRINPTDDVDCFRMTFSQNQLVQAVVDNSTNSCGFSNKDDTRLWIYADGETNPDNSLAADDDGGEGYCPAIEFVAMAGQSLILCIEGYPHADLPVHDDVVLNISTSPLPADEAGGPDSPRDISWPISGFSFALAGAQDQDCFNLSVPSPSVVNLTVDRGTLSCPADAQIYAANDLSTALAVHNGVACTYADFALDSGEYILCFQDDSTLEWEPGYVLDAALTQISEAGLCEQALELTLPSNGSPVQVTGNNSDAADTRELSYLCGDFVSGGEEVFYQINTGPDMDGYIHAELIDTSFTGYLTASAGDCQTWEDLACDTSEVYFPVVPNSTYYLIFDSSSGGSFTMQARYIPLSSESMVCENAESLALSVAGDPLIRVDYTDGDHNNRDSSFAGNTSCQATAHYAPERFYAFTTPAQSGLALDVDFFPAGWQSALYMFKEGCDATEDVMCQGNEYGGSYWFRQSLQAQSTYYLVVDGYGDTCCDDTSGFYELQVDYYTPPPTLAGGETCSDAVPLPGRSGLIHGSTETGSNEVGPDDIGCSLGATGYDKFYQINVPAGHKAEVRFSHGQPGTKMVGYVMHADCPVRGNSCIDEVLVISKRSDILSWTNTSDQAQDYFVVVDARYSYYGEPYDLSWEIQ